MERFNEKIFLARVGKKIKEYRQFKHYSQAQLAELCNISEDLMIRIEQGKENILVDLLLSISNFLRVPVEDFF